MIFSASFYSTEAFAAEEIVLKYLGFQQSFAVKDLHLLAQTGEVSSSLQSHLSRANQDPQRVRQVLTETIEVDAVVTDRVLNSWAGELLLDQIGQVIHTPSGQADRQAIRAAVMLSASQDGKLSLLEVIQNYPTTEVLVEGDRLIQAYAQLQALRGNLFGIL